MGVLFFIKAAAALGVLLLVIFLVSRHYRRKGRQIPVIVDRGLKTLWFGFLLLMAVCWQLGGTSAPTASAEKHEAEVLTPRAEVRTAQKTEPEVAKETPTPPRDPPPAANVKEEVTKETPPPQPARKVETSNLPKIDPAIAELAIAKANAKARELKSDTIGHLAVYDAYSVKYKDGELKLEQRQVEAIATARKIIGQEQPALTAYSGNHPPRNPEIDRHRNPEIDRHVILEIN